MSITMGWSLCIERRCWLARLSLSAKRYSHKYVGLFLRMYFAQQEFLLKRQSANLSCSSTLRLWVCCFPMMPGSIIEHGFIEHGPEAMMFHRYGQGSPPKEIRQYLKLSVRCHSHHFLWDMGDIGRVGTPDSEAPNRPMQCYRETAPFLDRKKKHSSHQLVSPCWGERGMSEVSSPLLK